MANQQGEQHGESKPMNTDDREPVCSSPCGSIYEIQVKGHLDSQWSDWLGGMQVKLLENGEMILSGEIVDQAALMGILNNLNRLNLPIISVNEVVS